MDKAANLYLNKLVVGVAEADFPGIVDLHAVGDVIGELGKRLPGFLLYQVE
jgi:hypothetical protein